MVYSFSATRRVFRNRQKDLSGQLAISGKANGVVNSPTVSTEIESKNLIVDGLPIDEAQLNLTVANLLNHPSGTLATKVSLNEIDASTSTEFVMQSDDRLNLNNIKVQGFGTEIVGDMQVNLKPVSIAGALNGKIRDYAPINNLLGQELSANTRFGVNFNNESGQAVKFSAQVENLKLDGDAPLAVKIVNLTGEVENALDDPQIKSQLKISEAIHPKAKLKNMVLKAQGSTQEMEYDLKAVLDEGPSGKLNTTGKLSLDGDFKKAGHEDIIRLNGRHPL